MADQQNEPGPQAQTKIEFFRSWCKKCGICAAFCPKNVIEQDHDGSPYVARPEDCIECLLCETRCPDFAIKVNRSEKRSGEEVNNESAA